MGICLFCSILEVQWITALDYQKPNKILTVKGG